MSYHLFLSYSRRDNAPPAAGGEGWVTAFKAALEARHRARSGRELRIFFDRDSIGEGRDWRREIGIGLRQSRLFLAFLSPHYVTSENCLWEWAEYLRREHSAARGDDGIMPVFFVTPDDLRIADRQDIAGWLREMERKYPWFSAEAVDTQRAERLVRPFAADLSRRNQRAPLELHPWFDEGPAILRVLDAAGRSEDVKQAGRGQAGDLRTLDQRLADLEHHVARRLDRLALADLAPGNMPRSHEHFVGRHRELTALHDVIVTGGPRAGARGTGGYGMIAATFAPGGLGKTALARQYAHAYAEFFAAGGTWEIGCEGLTTIGAALARLAESADFQRACENGFDVTTQRPVRFTEPLLLSKESRRDDRIAAREVVDYLRRVTSARQSRLLDEFARRVAEGSAERHTPAADVPELATPRALLVLDNVDRPELLSAEQLALLPSGEWLELIVTTRLDPTRFGGGERVFSYVEVGMLPEDDAVRLLADFQPGGRFGSAADEEAARGIALALGGYTLAVELVAAYLGTRAHDGYGPTDHLRQLESKGLVTPVDALAGEGHVAGRIRHRANVAENQIASLVGWSLARLSPRARTAIEFASLLMPDSIPLRWLEALTAGYRDHLPSTRFSVSRSLRALREWLGPADVSAPSAASVGGLGYAIPWAAVYRELRGLRLLAPAGGVEVDERGVEKIPSHVRIHRLVAAHIAKQGLPGKESAVAVFLEDVARRFEQRVGKGDDQELLAQHPSLLATLEHLVAARSRSTPAILRSAFVAASHEGLHGSLNRAIRLAQQVLDAWGEQSPPEGEAPDSIRDVSSLLGLLSSLVFKRDEPGDAEQSLAYADRSVELHRRMLATQPSTAALRDFSVSSLRMGDLLSYGGLPEDAERAFTHYENAILISEKLFEKNRESERCARDLAATLDHMSHFLARRDQLGDFDRALSCRARCLEISEHLHEANPESSENARDTAVALARMATLLCSRGKPEDCELGLTHSQRSVAISDRLHEMHPESKLFAADLADRLGECGDLLGKRGHRDDLVLALGHVRRCLAIRERLHGADPDSLEAAAQVSAALFQLGDVLVLGGLPEAADEALRLWERSLTLAERIREVNPDNARVARRVSVYAKKIGYTLFERNLPGDVERALGFFQRSLDIDERLCRETPRGEQAAQAVLLGLRLLSMAGDFFLTRDQSGDAERSLDAFQLCRRICEGLQKSSPTGKLFTADLARTLERLARLRHDAGMASEARELQDRALGLRMETATAGPEAVIDRTAAAETAMQAARYAADAGRSQQAAEYRKLAYDLLQDVIATGASVDAHVLENYEEVSKEFRGVSEHE